MICTPLTAFFCPLHGDCTCARTDVGDCCFDGPTCPLHSAGSDHAETIGLDDIRERIETMAREAEIVLTENDRSELERFAMFLQERRAERVRN